MLNSSKNNTNSKLTAASNEHLAASKRLKFEAAKSKSCNTSSEAAAAGVEARVLIKTAMLCWGSNKHGQLGLGGVEEEVFNTPTENKFFEQKSNIKQIACGYNHTLMLLNDGILLSCGNNDFEQLGHDGPRKRPEVIKTLEIHFFVQIACGYSFSMALNNLGQIFCWGSISGNRDGDLFFSKPTLVYFLAIN